MRSPDPEDFELHPGSASAFTLSDDDDSDDDDSTSSWLLRQAWKKQKKQKKQKKWKRKQRLCIFPTWLLRYPNRRTILRSLRRRALQLLAFTLLAAWGILVIFTIIFRPSYTRSQYPASWAALEASIDAGGGPQNPPEYWRHPPGTIPKTTVPGRGNLRKERIFIAANIVNAALIEEEWGGRVLELIDLLGPENTFLSIFENDSGNATTAALRSLADTLAAHMPTAGQSIVSTTLPFATVPRVRLPNGESHIKRIRYLAEVRNRALLPLIGTIPSLQRWNQSGNPVYNPIEDEVEELSEWELLPPLSAEDLSRKPAVPTAWVDKQETVDRVLFLNDVVFDPREVVHLLFSTNGGAYATACGTDYINPLKYYDTFATRDVDGFPLGVPFFPYFATPGPRAQVLSTAAEVNVASCWGGVVAFNASFFTRKNQPVRFRAEPEPFWDASECCLVNADIGQPHMTFMNPFVRTAYSRRTFDWLPFVRRIEKSFVIPHSILLWALSMPWSGPRRAEVVGSEVRERGWDGKGWSEGVRKVKRGGMCGGRKLLVMEETPKAGGRKWKGLPVPPEVGKDGWVIGAGDSAGVLL